MNVLLYGVFVVRSLLTQEAVVLMVPFDELQDEIAIIVERKARANSDFESRIEVRFIGKKIVTAIVMHEFSAFYGSSVFPLKEWVS